MKIDPDLVELGEEPFQKNNKLGVVVGVASTRTHNFGGLRSVGKPGDDGSTCGCLCGCMEVNISCL